MIIPAAAASAVEAKKEDDLNHGEHQLREAEATVATKHIMQRLRGSGSVQVQRAKMLCQRRLLERNTRGYALLMDLKVNLKEEVCVSGMGRRRNYAAAKDARVLLETEECV